MQTEYIPLPETDTYALRWTGLECGIRPSLVLDAANATSFDEFRRAVWGVACPGQNFVYADVDGTIGYQCTGLYPVRRAGDGSGPVPGWTDEHEWDGWIAFDELPWAVDPALGYLVTANNRIHDDDYPHLIGHDFHGPYRARRVAERLEDVARHDVASMARIQSDTVSIPAREALPSLLALEPTERRRARRDRAARRVGRRHVRGVRRRGRVQRVVATHRAPGAGAAPGRGAVPPLPRGSRGLPVRGPAGVAARSGRMARRRRAPRGARRRARRAPGAPGSGSVRVAMGGAAPRRAGPSARLDPRSGSALHGRGSTRSAATSRR